MNLKSHVPETTKPKNQAPSGRPFIQPKLSINTPGDTYEQEADAMADKVMRMQMPGSPDSFSNKSGNDRYYDPFRPEVSDPFIKPANSGYDPFIKPANGGNNPFFKPSIKAVQRKHHGPDESEDEQQLHRKKISILRKWNGFEDREEMLHRKESTKTETQAGSSLDSYVNSLGSSGQPLPDASRQFFEPRFGHDFSGVKIHNDSVAAKSAQSINALAYTTGNNIVFNEGQYAPSSDSGNRLLAHELTHVVQQSGNEKVMKQDKKDKKTAQTLTEPPQKEEDATQKYNWETGWGKYGDPTKPHPIQHGPLITITNIITGFSFQQVYAAKASLQTVHSIVVPTYAATIEYFDQGGTHSFVGRFNVTRDAWFGQGTDKDGKDIFVNRSTEPRADVTVSVKREFSNRYMDKDEVYYLEKIHSPIEDNEVLEKGEHKYDVADKFARKDGYVKDEEIHVGGVYINKGSGKLQLAGSEGCFAIIGHSQIYSSKEAAEAELKKIDAGIFDGITPSNNEVLRVNQLIKQNRKFFDPIIVTIISRADFEKIKYITLPNKN